MPSFATSPDRIKGMGCGSLLIALAVLRLLRLPGSPPLGTMFDNPIRQRPFKPDIVAGLLRLDPFVLQNLLTLGLELAVKAGVFHQVVARSVWSLAHSLMVELLSSSECNIGYPVDNRKLRTGRTTVQLGATTSLLRPVCKISEDPTLSLSMNQRNIQHRTPNAEHRMAARILAHFGVRSSILDVRCFPSAQGGCRRLTQGPLAKSARV